jgi:hypothetical protein
MAYDIQVLVNIFYLTLLPFNYSEVGGTDFATLPLPV